MRLIRVDEAALAVRVAGALGAVVSGGVVVVVLGWDGAPGCLKQLASRNTASRNARRSSTPGLTTTKPLTLPVPPSKIEPQRPRNEAKSAPNFTLNSPGSNTNR